MAKKSRDKGSRVERKIRKMFETAGMNSVRVGFLPMLGIQKDGDLEIEGRSFEVKARANGGGFKSIQNWLGPNYGLVLVEDHKEPLIVQRFSDWINSRGTNEQIRSNTSDSI